MIMTGIEKKHKYDMEFQKVILVFVRYSLKTEKLKKSLSDFFSSIFLPAQNSEYQSVKTLCIWKLSICFQQINEEKFFCEPDIVNCDSSPNIG